jgi:hypothetical protein
VDNTSEKSPFEPKQPTGGRDTSIGTTPSLISFDEMARLCADRSSRTIVDNDAWIKREWVALGKLLEALFADQLGEVRIDSDGMTEADAIARDGSISNFIQQRLASWLRIKFQFGACVKRPRTWDGLSKNGEAQALADAYIRPCQVERSPAETWLLARNIRLPSSRAERALPTRLRRKVGRPRKEAQLLQVGEIIEQLTSERIRELLGQDPPFQATLATRIIQTHHIDIKPKTVTNRYGRKLKRKLGALN